MPVVPRREFGDHDRISIKFLGESLEVAVLLLWLRAERILPGAQSISESLSHSDGCHCHCAIAVNK